MHDWQATLRDQIPQRQDPWLVLEGREMVEAALAGWWEVVGVLLAGEQSWQPPVWSGMELARIEPGELSSWSDDSRHGGVLGLAKIPAETGEVAAFLRGLETDAVLVVCPRLASAEIAGVAMRLAAEHDAAGVLFGAEGVSPFHPDALRVAGPAAFRLPVRIADGGLLLRSLRAAGVELCGWEHSTQPTPALSPAPGRRALVMGDPEEGLGPFWRAACRGE